MARIHWSEESVKGRDGRVTVYSGRNAEAKRPENAEGRTAVAEVLGTGRESRKLASRIAGFLNGDGR